MTISGKCRSRQTTRQRWSLKTPPQSAAIATEAQPQLVCVWAASGLITADLRWGFPPPATPRHKQKWQFAQRSRSETDSPPTKSSTLDFLPARFPPSHGPMILYWSALCKVFRFFAHARIKNSRHITIIYNRAVRSTFLLRWLSPVTRSAVVRNAELVSSSNLTNQL